MRAVIDIETNRLENPDQIWVIVCKDLSEAGDLHIFRKVTQDEAERQRFFDYAQSVSTWVGHNISGFDLPVLGDLLGYVCPQYRSGVRDTLIVSRLVDYSRSSGHSIEAYGEEFGYPKIKFSDWSDYSKEMEDYCVRDVEIAEKVFEKYRSVIEDPSWQSALELEHEFQLICNALHDKGFAFNTKAAERLLEKVQKELGALDAEIRDAFPPRLRPIREINPVVTKHGTLHRKDFKWVKSGDLSEFNGGPFTRCEWVEFNPDSAKQRIDVLKAAGWKPHNKTDTHIEVLRELTLLKRSRTPQNELDLLLKDLHTRLHNLETYGWKTDEENLATLPSTAPPSARSLAKRITLESRRRTLTEWLGLVSPEGRIHGEFHGIGAWTHRMAHRKPNMANIPREFHEDGSPKLLGKELRSLWQAPRKRLLVGVDAEGIQLRIFAHYINDPEFTEALVKGKKDDKTDPHSLNQRILGSVCKTRQAAKRFIYALLLGGGIGKLSQVLGCSESETREALDRLLKRYQGFQLLKTEVIPKDAASGYFVGLDGRKVPIPGRTQRDREHLCMSGYLQNGEGIVIKKAACIVSHKLGRQSDWFFVDIVHDELQSEVKNDMQYALQVAKIKADAIEEAGRLLNLRCPMAGSYWSDDIKDYTIGTNWYQTH